MLRNRISDSRITWGGWTASRQRLNQGKRATSAAQLPQALVRIREIRDVKRISRYLDTLLDDRIAKTLQEGGGLRVIMPFHSMLDGETRVAARTAFGQGEIRILLVTDWAMVGLDFSVETIVIFDLPEDVHGIGLVDLPSWPSRPCTSLRVRSILDSIGGRGCVEWHEWREENGAYRCRTTHETAVAFGRRHGPNRQDAPTSNPPHALR